MDAAAEEFATHGFAGARVDRIARAAGVNKATLYYRIGDKQTLYLEVLKSFFGELLQRVERDRPESDDPREQLRHRIRTLVRCIDASPDMRAILLHEMASGTENIPHEMGQFVSQFLIGLRSTLNLGVEQGLFRPADLFTLHMLVLGGAHFYLASREARGRIRRSGHVLGELPEHPDADSLADAITDLLLHGIALPAPALHADSEHRP